MITVKEARGYGYEISKGEYVGTTDNRLDRWYIGPRKYGKGFATRREALEVAARWVEEDGIRRDGENRG